MNINQSTENEAEHIDNREIFCNVMELLLGGIQKMYEEIGVEIFSEEFYSIARYCRIWNKMTKILIFLLQDRPEDRKVVLYSQLYVLSDNYQQIVQKMPYGMVEVPYDWFELSFHIELEGSEWTDKLIVFKFLTDGLTIRLSTASEFGAPIPESDEGELQPSYEIKVSSTQVVSFKTFYMYKEHCVPTTLRVLALNGVPIGVSVMIYDITLCEEFSICFLIIHPRRPPLPRCVAEGRAS
jgi:hypothetical protein